MKRRLFTALAMLVLTVVFAVSVNAAATELSTAEDIINLMNTSGKWSGDYVLKNDIDLGDYTGSKKQAPIGNSGTPFTGTFDGQGYTISGLNLSGAGYVALFGHIKTATIQNLTVDGVVKSTAARAAGVVAAVASVGATIENCTNLCDVTVTGAGYAGGVVGSILEASANPGTTIIRGCKNEGTIKGAGDFVGGIVGPALATGGTIIVEKCWNDGYVEGIGKVGGIVGIFRIKGTAAVASTVADCLNTAEVKCTSTGTSSRLGGIIGDGISGTAQYTVDRCFNSGKITTAASTPGLVQPIATTTDYGVTYKGTITDSYYSSTETYYFGYKNNATLPGVSKGSTLVEDATVAANFPKLNTDAWIVVNGRAPELAVFHNHNFVGGYCSTCGAPDCDHVDTGRTYDNVDPATCLKTGSRDVYCANCSTWIKNEELPIDPGNHAEKVVNATVVGGKIALSTTCCNVDLEADAIAAVYVDAANGVAVTADTDVTGLGTATKPFKNLEDALAFAAAATEVIEGEDNVTVYVNGAYVLEGVLHTPECDEMITLCGKTGASADSIQLVDDPDLTDAILNLNGPMTIKNIKIDNTGICYIAAQGNKLVIDEGVETNYDSTTSPKQLVYVMGGYSHPYYPADAWSYDTNDVTIRSGEYHIVTANDRYVNKTTNGGDSSLTLGAAGSTLTIHNLYVHSVNYAKATADSKVTVTVKGPVTIDNFQANNGTVSTGVNFDIDFVVEGTGSIAAAPKFNVLASANSKVAVYSNTDYDADGNVYANFKDSGKTTVAKYPLAMYCVTVLDGHKDGADEDALCDVCGIEKHDAHAATVTMDIEVVIEATCVATGLQYDVCPVCLHRENRTVLEIDENNHDLVWDLSGDVAVCSCIREGCGHTVDLSAVEGIYVSASGNDDNDGMSAAKAVASYTRAFDIAAKLGKDAKVYLTGTVSLPARVYDNQYNKKTNSFEESPHASTITVTTAPGASKATLKFASGSAFYFLYGPTTFTNINIQAATAGTGKLVGDARDSGGIFFAGRGFHLTMGLGVAMPKISKDMTLTKNNSGMPGLNATVKVSDSKVYVLGGFQKDGYYAGVNETAALNSDAELTILSGTYWLISGGNRGFGSAVRNGKQVKMTIGDPTISTRVQVLQVFAFCIDAGTFNNCVADVHYTGRITAGFNYRALYTDAKANASNTVNHFFHKQYSSSKIGDFAVGARADCAVNLYYATAIENNSLLTGFRAKSEKYAVSYKQVGEEMSFPEWCIERSELKAHDYASGVCSFCDITACKTHPMIVWEVVKEPTCNEEGLEAGRCTECFEHVDEIAIPVDENAHVETWVYGENAATCVCSICGKTLKTLTYADLAIDGEVHVSAAGNPNGDGTAAAPFADYALAMAVAAAQTEDVTVYIHDMAIIPDSGSSASMNDFMEPAHTNRITVTGYGDTHAILRFNGDTPNGFALIYNVNGPTTFENLEFSGWNATSRLYIAARHNPLVMGKGVTSDYQTGVAQDQAGTDIILIGGCYGSSYNPAGGCAGLDVNLTVLSGSYGTIIGGGYRCKTCATDFNGADGDIHLTLGGDVTVRREFWTGNVGNASYYSNANNIYIDIVGNITVAKEFGFGSYGGKAAPYYAKNVYLTLHNGEIHGGSFAHSAAKDPYALGGVLPGYATTDSITGKLYVYADAASRSSLVMYNLLVNTLRSDERNDGKWEATLLDDSYCHVNRGDHTQAGAAIEHVDATCVAEGYDMYHCSACEKDYVEKIEMLPHAYGDVLTIAATCIAPEMERETCSACGGVKNTVVGNTFADHTDPEKTGFCQICNLDLTANCEHAFGEEVPFASGCGMGTKRTCDNCGKVEVEVFGDGHDYGKYVVTVEPTETTAGVKSRTCKGCGKVETALLYATDAVNASAVATDADGNLADLAVENSKLTKSERAALNALLQQDAYGTEVKISYETNGDSITNITYSIPVPAEYMDYENVRIVVRDDDGKIYFVDFKVEKGYIVFTF